MKAAPQKRRPHPHYPTKLEVQKDPELLRNLLPATWAASPELSAAAAILLAVVLSGCERTPPDAAKAEVAPIFDHGPGRGSTGCVAVAPPVFLSEEEAWQVIDEELAGANISLPDRMLAIPGTNVSQRVVEHVKQGDTWRMQVVERPETATQFKADRGNKQHHLAVEFVSQERYAEEGGPTSNSTASSYNFKIVATTLASQVAQTAKEPIRFGVFYDPLASCTPIDPEIRINLHDSPLDDTEADWRNGYELRKARARAESKRLLRLQVQDFIHWLQAQGAI